MAYSYTSIAADGSTNTFAVPFPYIAKSHVAVKVNGVATTFTWPTTSTITTTDTAASLAGKTVEIRRTTPRATRLVDFQDSANLTEAILDQSALQMFYLAQENLDDSADKLTLDPADVQWDARSKRIKAVATPTAGTDAVNKTYADSIIDAAAASAAASAASAAAALISEGNADTSEAAALLSANNADISEAAALASQVAAAASVASLNLPTITSGDKGKTLVVNNAGTGYDFTPPRNRNRIINGNFDIWQRGTSFSAAGYNADRWTTMLTGSTGVFTRQAFTPGQASVPGEPAYYHQSVITSVAGAGNFAIKAQRIESVRSFAGQTVTLSFYAKASVAKNIAVEFEQSFGTGGSPSAAVDTFGGVIALTTSWQKFTVTCAIPSISGKTLGSNNDDLLAIYIWLDAGSTFAARAGSIGQLSATISLSQVQMEAGSVATPFEDRSIGQELALCQRYFFVIPANTGFGIYGYNAAAQNSAYGMSFPTTMRAAPTVVVGALTSSNSSGLTILATNTTMWVFAAATALGAFSSALSGASPCTFSAEL